MISNPAMTKVAMDITSMNIIAMDMTVMDMTAMASLPLAMDMNNTKNQVMAITSTTNCENGRKETTTKMLKTFDLFVFIYILFKPREAITKSQYF